MRFKSILILTFFFIGLAFAQPALGADTPPNEVIQDQVDSFLVLLDDKSLIKPENHDLLKEKLIQKFEPMFAFREMTLRALGTHGRQLDDGQIDEVATVFRNLLEEIYVSRLTGHLTASEDTTVIDSINVTDTEKRGSYARVNSSVLLRKGNETSELGLNYKMVNRGDEWKIYDVEIEGVSLIANYRSQFSNILANESVDVLLKRLKEKLEQKREQDGTSHSDTTSDSIIKIENSS